MTFKVSNQIAASDIPILHDSVVTDSKMMSGVRMDGESIHSFFIRNMQMLNRVHVPVYDLVCSRIHEILIVVRPADSVDRTTTRCNDVLRLTPEWQVPASHSPVSTR